MFRDPELERLRKVRQKFNRKFKSVEEAADYLMELDKKDRSVVYATPPESNHSGRRQVTRAKRSRVTNSSNPARKTARKP